jgi:hypothetical protein
MARKRAAKEAADMESRSSFAAIASQWMEHWRDKSFRHVDSTRRRLDANILPALGPLQITNIQAPDGVAMVRTIEVRGA